jgi:putative MFS transporter
MTNIVEHKQADVAIADLFDNLALSKRHIVCCLILFVVYIIEAWEMMIIIYAAPLVTADLQLTTTDLGSLISAIFIGMGIGALFWGVISDKFGRKKSIIWSLILYSIISLFSAFSETFWQLYCARLVSGIAAAGMLVICVPYFQELLPTQVRGKLSVYLAAGWPFGILVAVGMTVLLGDHGWRWIIGVSAICGLWALMMQRYLPESPYWCVKAGHQQKAKDAISYLSNGSITLAADQRIVVPVTLSETKKGFKFPLVVISLNQIVVSFMIAWGYWGLQSWLPSLLEKRGLSLPQSFEFIALSALFMLPGYIVASWLTGKFGRKKVFMLFISLAAVSGYLFAHSSTETGLYASNFALSFFSLGAYGVWGAWVGEFYPTSIRATGYSITIVTQRVANILAPMLIGYVLSLGWTFTSTTFFIDAFLFAAAFFAIFLPETEGRTLS